jgi:hypothetical protein
MDRVNFGGALHTFATEFFCMSSKREMWVATGTIDRTILWLKIMFDQRRKP